MVDAAEDTRDRRPGRRRARSPRAVQPRPRRARRTDRARTAPPSAPAGPDSPAPPPLRRRRSRPATPTGTGARLPIEQIHRQIRRSAGRSGSPRPSSDLARHDPPVGDVHRGLGDAVHVDQPRPLVAVALAPTAARRRGSSASPPKITRRRPAAILAGSCVQRAGRTRDGVWLSTVTRFAAQQLAERLRRAAHRLRHHHQPAAVQQRAPQLPDREVEREGVEQRPHVAGAEAEPGSVAREQAEHVAVRHHHALRACPSSPRCRSR